MNHIRKLIIPISIVIGIVIGIAIGVTSTDDRWHSKYRFHVQDISDLTDQYTHHRAETGAWPDAKELYGAFFHLRGSTKSANGREDVFSDSSFGLEWLRFRLTDDGHIYAEILKDSPAGFTN